MILFLCRKARPPATCEEKGIDLVIAEKKAMIDLRMVRYLYSDSVSEAASQGGVWLEGTQ